MLKPNRLARWRVVLMRFLFGYGTSIDACHRKENLHVRYCYQKDYHMSLSHAQVVISWFIFGHNPATIRFTILQPSLWFAWARKLFPQLWILWGWGGILIVSQIEQWVTVVDDWRLGFLEEYSPSVFRSCFQEKARKSCHAGLLGLPGQVPRVSPVWFLGNPKI